ncbi:MAG TPA: hypothetical protein VFM88_23400 [Vicinamibacteria bacterium]|nr:hypothetical protein [Vicinamibacteria bacterium]
MILRRPAALVFAAVAASVLAVEAPGAEAVPVVREARYRMAAAVRPLLVFWIRAGNVGGARILWRSGDDGRRGYEILIGSDPRRAPRKVNRWGWEREDLGPEGATLFGLMRKTDEESLGEATTQLAREGDGGFLYKAIRSRVADTRVRAENTLWRVGRDLSYRDLGELHALVSASPGVPPRVREARLPEGTHPGFLFAVAALIDQAVATALRPATPRHLPSDLQATFTFNASLYDLRLRSSRWLESATYAGRRYERLLQLNLEHFNREKRTRERFVLVCGTEGPLSRIPVFIEYQPKWWFKAQGVLDDSEVFPEPPPDVPPAALTAPSAR